MKAEKLNKLKNLCHSEAVANGWHEEKREIDDCLTLVDSEMSEALDAFRANKRLVLSVHTLSDLSLDFEKDSSNFVKIFKENIKDTFEDEIADVFIRVLDVCGLLSIELDDLKIFASCETFIKDAKHFKKLIVSCYDAPFTKTQAALLLGYTYEIARNYKIDLEEHILLKLQYNRTRGKRHGKLF